MSCGVGIRLGAKCAGNQWQYSIKRHGDYQICQQWLTLACRFEGEFHAYLNLENIPLKDEAMNIIVNSSSRNFAFIMLLYKPMLSICMIKYPKYQRKRRESTYLNLPGSDNHETVSILTTAQRSPSFSVQDKYWSADVKTFFLHYF